MATTTVPIPHLHLLQLPLEILLTILKYSSTFHDVANLRLTHPIFNLLYTSNQNSIFSGLVRSRFPAEAIDLLNCLRPNALSPYQQERMVLSLNDVADTLRERDRADERADEKRESLDWAVYFSGDEDSNPRRLHPDPKIFRRREYVALLEQYDALVKGYTIRFKKATADDEELENFFFWVHGLDVPTRLPRAPASETEVQRIEKAVYNMARMLKHFHTVVPEVDEEEGEYKLDHSEILIAKKDGQLVIDDTAEFPYAHTDLMVIDAKGVIQELSVEAHMNIVSVVYFFTNKKVAWAMQGGYIYLLNEILQDRLVNYEKFGQADREDVYIDLCEARDFSIWDQFQTNVEFWAGRSKDSKFGYSNGFNISRYMALVGKSWSLDAAGKPMGIEREMWIPDHPGFHGSNMFQWDEEEDLLEPSDDETDDDEENGDVELLLDLDETEGEEDEEGLPTEPGLIPQ